MSKFVLFAFLFIGHPLKWRNVQLNVTSVLDDPGWRELIMWSNETLGEGPLLTTVGRNQSYPRAPTTNEQDDRMLKQLELLKVRKIKIRNSFNACCARIYCLY